MMAIPTTMMMVVVSTCDLKFLPVDRFTLNKAAVVRKIERKATGHTALVQQRPHRSICTHITEQLCGFSSLK